MGELQSGIILGKRIALLSRKLQFHRDHIQSGEEGQLPRFIGIEVGKVGLGTLDAGLQHRLPTDEGSDEQLGIGQGSPQPGQFPQGSVGIGQRAHQPAIIG